MKLIVKYFFLADVLFLGAAFDLDKYIFPQQMWFFFWGGGLLGLFCFQENMILF